MSYYIHSRDFLRINDVHGNLLAFFCKGMPEELRSTLYSNLKAMFGDLQSLIWLDTKKARDEGKPVSFQTLHWCWWARYCTQVRLPYWNLPVINLIYIQGDDALKDVHPLQQQREGTTRTNYTQLTPYPSKDMEEYRDLYERGRALFKPVFEWIQDVVRLTQSILGTY